MICWLRSTEPALICCCCVCVGVGVGVADVEDRERSCDSVDASALETARATRLGVSLTPGSALSCPRSAMSLATTKDRPSRPPTRLQGPPGTPGEEEAVRDRPTPPPNPPAPCPTPWCFMDDKAKPPPLPLPVPVPAPLPPQEPPEGMAGILFFHERRDWLG